MMVGQLALIAATAFSGAAAYINLVEQPARLDLEPAALLVQWKRSYKRGTVMQVSLAVTAAALGLASFAATRDGRWLLGVLLLLTLLPYTFIGVMPTNRRLMAIAAGGHDPWIVSGIRRWGGLHAVRTGLGIAAVLAFLWATL